MENNEFIKRLKLAIEKSGLTQTEICDRTGITKGALSSYLSGRYIPKNDNTYKLAKVLNVSPAWLIGANVPMYWIAERDITSADKALLGAYHATDPDIQLAIRLILGLEK